ncbi:type II toxin-antitoxin system VapC family toxin [Tsukamurella sp. NPDC003166]|uniref:type II toxin-antitoxin system VapC family toxin n=1 Tax=Tsukamurella sp. NPDC003166 TaxID=3154444 RepID=UPI0033A76FE2
MVTTYYLDTSVAVHGLLFNVGAEAWLDATAGDGEHTLASSRILQTELTRVLRRDGEPVSRRHEILDLVSLAPATEAILTSAESITQHLRTLDAIHLATALALGSRTVMVTHDARLAEVAEAHGLTVEDPVT